MVAEVMAAADTVAAGTTNNSPLPVAQASQAALEF